MSISRFSAAIALLTLAGPAFAQITYSFDFAANATGWTGNYLYYTGATTCSGTGGAVRRNLYSGATTGQLVSPLTGTTSGGTVTLSYDYKAAVWSANTVGAPTPWGGFDVQYGASASGPWTTIATITDEAQTGSCLPQAHVFNPPAGPLYIRWAATWTGGDYYLNFDNVILSESLTPCGGTPAPGNTTGPTGACIGAPIVLGVQNATAGTGVSYQWYESTFGPGGPYAPVGVDSPTHTATQSVTTWYYADVTCTAGPSTGTSAPIQVDMLGLALPEEFGSGVVTPGCWAISGTASPIYSAVSAWGVGTGSARLNFYSISAGATLNLTSPLLPPTVAGDQVFFDAAGALYSGDLTLIDTVDVLESNDGGLTWTLVTSMTNDVAGGVLNTGGAISPSFLPAANQWKTLSFPLTPGTNRIQFAATSGFGNNVHLDNIHVGGLQPAKSTTYGAGCGTPPMTLSATPHPVSTGAGGTQLTFNIGDIPLACPSPDPVFHFGIVVLSLGQDLPGTDLTVYSIDSPGCNLHVTSLDLTIAYVGSTPTQSVTFDVPAGAPAGFEFFGQAVALICPVAPNNAGVVLSNGTKAFVNSY